MRISSVVSMLVLAGGLSAAFAQSPMSDLTLNLDQEPLGPAAAPKKPVMFDLNSIDKTADPCTDFYQYACGNWMKNNAIPPTESRWGSFNTLGEQNQYLLWKELDAASKAPKTPLQKKYGDFYAACMNTELIDKLGAKPIEPQLTVINGLTDKKKIAQLDLAMQKFGGGGMFGVSVGQDQKDSSQQILQAGAGGGGGRGGGGGLGLPDRDYYLDTDARSVKIREQYVAHVTAMFTLLDGNGDKAAAEAADVMRIETALAKGTLRRDESRDPAARYHIMTVDELQALTPDFDWHVLLNGMQLGQVKTLNVTAPKLMAAMNTEIDTEPLSALQTYMKWHVLNGAAPNLSKPFANEAFLFNATLSGQKEQQPRWKTCTRMTDQALGQAVGQDWVKENFPPQAKENMAKLVKALEKALDEDIRSLPWMSDATKAEAEKKLMAFRDKIGYPDKWLDYSKFNVSRTELIGNLQQDAIFQRNRNLARLGQPVDEREMGMTPPTVNASYSPQMNDITFPAGILQPPFYDVKLDWGANFGAIGVVIGHEMTHGFDDEGAKYGPTGNVVNWFTPRRPDPSSTSAPSAWRMNTRASPWPRVRTLTASRPWERTRRITAASASRSRRCRRRWRRRASRRIARSMDTRRISGSSSASGRCGARTRPIRRSGARPRPMRTAPASTARTEPCRTSTNSARRSGARSASR